MSSDAAGLEHNASNIRNCQVCLRGVTSMAITENCTTQTGKCDQLRLHETTESLARTQHLFTDYGNQCTSPEFAGHRDCPEQACTYIDERLSEELYGA